MDQENPKEREVARLLREAADYLAVQPVEIAMVGRLIIRETHQKCKESVPQGHGKNKLQVRKSESVVMEIERHLYNRPPTLPRRAQYNL